MTRPPHTPTNAPTPPRRTRGFEAAGRLMEARIAKAGEKRGFAITRLLTHWEEVAGPDLAAVTRPLKVGYARDGFGATLTLLVAPAHAPLVEMRKPALRDRVNAVYGYNAISRITLTQTAPQGFAEGRTPFAPAPKSPPPPPAPDPRAAEVAGGIHDDGLRAALETLAQNVFSRAKSQKGT